MVKEAMDTKENQMVAIGAQLVQDGEVERTATEAKLEATSEGSTLKSAALNVQAAYVWAIEQAALFTDETINEDAFILNTDFELSQMTVEERRATVEEWIKGAITFGEMRSTLRKAGSATLDDEEAKKVIDEEADAELERAVKAMEAQNAASGEDDESNADDDNE